MYAVISRASGAKTSSMLIAIIRAAVTAMRNRVVFSRSLKRVRPYSNACSRNPGPASITRPLSLSCIFTHLSLSLQASRRTGGAIATCGSADCWGPSSLSVVAE